MKVGEKINQLQMYNLNKHCIYSVQRVLELETKQSTKYHMLTLSRFRMRISNMGFGLFGLATNTYEIIVYGYKTSSNYGNQGSSSKI